jgi:hypothetical protein
VYGGNVAGSLPSLVRVLVRDSDGPVLWLSWMWGRAGAWFMRGLGSMWCGEDGLKCGLAEENHHYAPTQHAIHVRDARDNHREVIEKL